MEHIERYEQAVAPARRAFADDAAVRLIQDPRIGADRLEAFFIQFSALGVAMTEPVEGWIRRAGEATVAVGGPGAETLGVALQKHARAEADHHLLMIEDLKRLCARRARAGRPGHDPDELLAQEWPESAHRYRRMHEDVIAGPEPYAQIAIENEIEMLSVEIGPGLLANARGLLGEEVLADLSFLTDHVELDAGHTKFNRRQMAKFLDERPDALDALVGAGIGALEAYRAFIGDCVARAGGSAGDDDRGA
ncbi:MAG TPA: hypothetical protein VM367_19070 [Pseudonocardia sp.]|nr:hypothetical protein [Pseudonocardia sp.]